MFIWFKGWTILNIRTFRRVIMAFIEYVAWRITEISTSPYDAAVTNAQIFCTPIFTSYIACSFTRFPKPSYWTVFATISHYPVTAVRTLPAFIVKHISEESCFASIRADPRVIGACVLYTINAAWLGTVSSIMGGIAF